MEPSIELQNLMLDFYKSLENGGFSFVENNFSKAEGVLVVGSDPNEWWEGYEAILDVSKLWAEISGIKTSVIDTRAYSEGSVGWAFSRIVMKMPGFQEMPMRTTAVFHRENGSWKIFHFHHSIAVPNEEFVE